MLNKLQIIGHVGRDAESRFTPSGQQVTNFSVACSEEFVNSSGEKVKKTIWVRVQSWGKLAEIVGQYVKKGMLIYVEGKLIGDEKGNPKIFETQTGHSSSFEMNAQTVKFLSKSEKVAAPEEQEDMPF